MHWAQGMWLQYLSTIQAFFASDQFFYFTGIITYNFTNETEKNAIVSLFPATLPYSSETEWFIDSLTVWSNNSA